MQNMDNHNNAVGVRLKKIFYKVFGIDFDGKDEEYYNRNLLGYFQFQARDLLDLYFYIEKEFNINIPEEDIISGKFCTFNNIAEIISKQFSANGQQSVIIQ